MYNMFAMLSVNVEPYYYFFICSSLQFVLISKG